MMIEISTQLWALMSKKVERYIITGAINNCKLFKKGLKSLKVLAAHYQAQLVVVPIKYNPYHLPQEEIRYNDELTTYLQPLDFEILNTSILSTINITPTAVKPLTSLGGFEGENNIIVAHPRLHRLDLPKAEVGQIKQLLTTGVITKANYSNSKTGKKAEFHHSYGCVILEIEDHTTYIRQVSIGEDGSICDLDTKVVNGTVTTATVESIVYGDIHEMFLAKAVRDKGLFHKDSLLNTLKPKQVVLHDIIDVFSVSHHHDNAPFTKYRVANGGSTIIDEIAGAITLLQDIIDMDVQPVVVSSNHNNHLTQWLERTSWKSNPRQAKEILSMTLMMLEYIDDENNVDGKTPDVFKLLIDKTFGDSIVTLSEDTPYTIGSFRVENHGHAGLNGARGLGASIANKMTTKMIVGHSHTANRTDGMLTVGTSSNLTRNYTSGLSTWSHTHAIIHDNNKAQLVTQDSVTGNYRLTTTVNSKGKLLKVIKGTTFEAHLTDEAYTNEGFKYKILDGDGKVMGYFKGYRAVATLFNESEWKARQLIETGTHHGLTVDYL